MIRIPLEEAPPIPPKKLRGIDITRAQGQLITSVVRALISHFDHSAGLPIIITNSGGMPEYAGKKCSIIVEKDANLQYSLAKQIKDLIENKDKRKAMGRYAELEATNYSITNMYNEFYKTLKLKVEKNNEVNKDKA